MVVIGYVKLKLLLELHGLPDGFNNEGCLVSVDGWWLEGGYIVHRRLTLSEQSFIL